MKKSIAIVATTLLFFSSCSKEEALTQPEKAPTIFAAGNETTTSGIEVARYWENGVFKDLTNNSRDASTSGIVVANNGDVYISGSEWTTSFGAVPRYWKNGTSQTLPTSHPDLDTNPTSMYTTDIAVSGNDVYVTGAENLSNDNHVATYWKNGVENYLSNPTNDTFTTAITVVSSTTYIIGYEINGVIKTPIIWINGLSTSLTSGVNDAYASDIIVIGTKIYIVGSVKITGNYYAGYWVKDTAISNSSFVFNALSTTIINGGAQSITSIGTDVYVSGYEGLTTKYWKVDAFGNKTATTITNSGTDCEANSIFAFGNDVYTVTFEDGIGCKYWKNGAQIMNLSTVTNGRISYIYVIQK